MKPGELIKNYRNKRNVTQKQLAEQFGWKPQFVSLIENGHSRLPLERANDFCIALKIPGDKMKKSLLHEYEYHVYRVTGL